MPSAESLLSTYKPSSIKQEVSPTYNPAIACSAVFFFFLPVLLTLPPLVLPVFTLLTLPLTLFFFFLTGLSMLPEVEVILVRPLVDFASTENIPFCLPSRFACSSSSRIRRSSSSQKSSRNISQPSMNSPSIAPRWFSTTLTPPSPNTGLGLNIHRRIGKFRSGWETGFGTSFKLNWRSDLFVWGMYFFG